MLLCPLVCSSTTTAATRYLKNVRYEESRKAHLGLYKGQAPGVQVRSRELGWRSHFYFAAGQGGLFPRRRPSGESFALCLLRLVAVSVPVQQVGVGGTFGEAAGGRGISQLENLVETNNQQA